jgi:hypothetical protein
MFTAVSRWNWTLRRFSQALLVVGLFAWIGSVRAGGPDPKVMSYKLPDQIKWTSNGSGAEVANLYGDPAKPGYYIYLNKWTPHHMSRPHYHPNDRFITVLKGTWWVGTGPKYDPDTTTAMPAGSFVVHYGKQIHWDGAKDEECVLLISGEGPAGSTSAEQK